MIPALEVNNLSVRYKEGNIALKHIDLSIASGEYLGIIGPNGGGKTTLFKAILGLIPHQGEAARFFGEPLAKVRSSVGYVPQLANIDKSYPISCKAVIQTALLKKGLNPLHKRSAEENERVEQLLACVELSKLQDRQIESLSGGEFQRLLIARALVRNPKLLLLDEPTANVDPASREKIFALLDTLNQEGVTIILISHDLMAIASNVKKLLCISEHLVYHGEPCLNEQIVTEMYGCPVDLIAHGVPHRVFPTHEEPHGSKQGTH